MTALFWSLLVSIFICLSSSSASISQDLTSLVSGKVNDEETILIPSLLHDENSLSTSDVKSLDIRRQSDSFIHSRRAYESTGVSLKHFDTTLPYKMPFDLPLEDLQYHGTTTLSFIFQDGLIVAVDSRASMGKYVGSSTTKKVFPITSHIMGTMAGGAADCSHYIRYTTRVMKLLEHRSNAHMPIKSIASLLAKTLREARGAQLSVGTMIGGYDLTKNQPQLFYVDNDGNCVSGDHFCVGSGSQLAYSVVDGKDFKHMSLSEAMDLAMMAIRFATYRDGYSGGYINLFHVTAEGIKHVKRIKAKDVKINGNN
jgi:20S proteasome subunit beta 5